MEGDDILSQLDAFEKRMMARTAIGRRMIEQEDRARQREAFKKLLERPDLLPEQRTRLQRLIDQGESSDHLGGMIHVEAPTEDHSAVGDFARGVAAGAVKGLTGAVRDLSYVVPNALGGRFLKESADESAALADETYKPQGKAGAAGDFAGAILGSAPEFALLSHAVASRLLKILPEGSKLASAIRGATSGSVGQRVIGQGVINLPIAAAQSALNEDLELPDKVKVFAINALAGAAGGLLPGEKEVPHSPKSVKIDPNAAAALPGERKVGLGENAELVQKALDQKAFLDWYKENRSTVAEAWQKSTGKDGAAWKSLKRQEKIDFAKQFKAGTGGEGGEVGKVEAGSGNTTIGAPSGGEGVVPGTARVIETPAAPDPIVQELANLHAMMPEGPGKAAVAKRLAEKGFNPDGSPQDFTVETNPTPREGVSRLGVGIDNGNPLSTDIYSTESKVLNADNKSDNSHTPPPIDSSLIQSRISEDVAQPAEIPHEQIARRAARTLMAGDEATAQQHYNELIDRGLTREQADELVWNEATKASDEDIASALKTGNGKVGAGMDKSIFKKLGENLYKSGIGSVVTKELLQNAIDGVRATGGGRVEASINAKTNTIEVSDTGVGMLPNVMEKEFVDIGGSLKPDGASGGYGLAKVGIISKAKQFTAVSVAKNAKGQKVMSTLTGTADDWINGNMDLTSEIVPNDYPTGTKITVELASDDIDPRAVGSSRSHFNYDTDTFVKRFASRNRLSEQGIDVVVRQIDPYGFDAGVRENRDPIADNFDHVESQKTPGSSIDFYTSHDIVTSDWTPTEIHVLNNGLYQFTMERYPKFANRPREIIVDVQPSVSVESGDYPFTTSREELKSGADKVLDEFFKTIELHGSRREVTQLADALGGGTPVVNGTKIYNDSPANLEPQFIEALSSRPYVQKYVTAVKTAIHAIHDAIAKGGFNLDDFEFGGIGLNDKYLGVNISRKILAAQAKSAGVDLGIPTTNLILTNPYALLREVGTDAHPSQLALQTIGTLIHEIAHQSERGHTEAFAGIFTRIIGPALDESSKHIGALTDAFASFGPDAISDYNYINQRFIDAQSANPNKKSIFGKISGHQLTDADLRGNPEGSQRSGGSEANPTGGAEAQPGHADTQLGGSGDPSEIAALRARFGAAQTAAEKGQILAEVRRKLGLSTREGPSLPTSIPDSRISEPAPSSLPSSTPFPDATLPPSANLVEQLALADNRNQLASIPHELPLSEMSMDQLDALKDMVFNGLDKTPGDPILSSDLEKLRLATLDLRRGGQQAAAQSPLHSSPPPEPVVGESVKYGSTAKQLSDEQLKTAYKSRAKLAGKRPQSMTDAELQIHVEDLQQKISDLKSSDPAAVVAYQDRLDKVITEQARRADPPRTTGVIANMPAHVGGAVGGFFAGAMFGDTDEERRRYAWMGAMIGLAGGAAIHYFHFKPKEPVKAMLPGEEGITKWVKTMKQAEALSKGKPFMSRMEDIYQQFIRPTQAVEKMTVLAGGRRLPAQLHPGKLLADFTHKVIQQGDAFIRGRPFFDLPNGERQYFIHASEDPTNGIMNAQEIFRVAQGDVETLGNYMAAMTTIEQHALKGRATNKIPLNDAIAYASAVPDHIKAAAKEARKLNRAILDVLNKAGVVSDDAYTKMIAEDWYAPMERILDKSLGETIGGRKSKVISNAPTTVHERRGADEKPIRNPFETLVMNIPRAMRAAEMNRIKLLMLDMREANPVLRAVIRPEPGQAVGSGWEERIRAIKQGINLDDESAKALATAMDPVQQQPFADRFLVWRRGSVEKWQVDPYIARSMQIMNPHEMDTIWQVLGIPAQFAKAGIVNNPIFVLYQGFRDNWQATINSQYGFRFGIDWIRGWLEAMRNTERFKRYGGEIQIQARESLNPTKALENMRIEDGNALYMAARYAKSGQLMDAYHALTGPVSEAARVGEYLRALDRGASSVEAVYAANQVVGNFRQIAPSMRALNHMAMFANPALRAIDQSLYASGLHPFRTPEIERTSAVVRYATKAVASIAIPSFLLWTANHGDEEIEQLRKTDYGNRYWWIRLPNKTLMKLPKPQGEGQVFGTSVEATLDRMRDGDPDTMARLVSSIRDDIAVNMLPTIGVVPASLVSNYDFNFGRPLVPEATSNLEARNQVAANTSVAARIVANAASPMSEGISNDALRRWFSPAGIDYLIRGFGGTLSSEAANAITAADSYIQERFIPPAKEWPVIRQAFGKYPSTAVEPLVSFYDNAEIIDRRARTMEYLAKTDVTQLADYMNRHLADIAQIDMYAQQRKELADLRQAIEDIRNAPVDITARREYIDAITQLMIEKAKAFNMVARAMKQ